MNEVINLTKYKSVLVGLTGGLNSAVAAMLLKIQKIDLIAVTLDMGPSFSNAPEKTFSCHINSERMHKIKNFCHSLNIPHHIIPIGSQFSDQVVDRWISQKLLGKMKDQCMNCHQMRMAVLYEKMIEVGADAIATGHFAKVHLHPTTKIVSINSANDEVEDQSSLLSNLPKEVLAKLLLPLSDLSTKEVVKLAENFFINLSAPEIKMNQCFPKNTETIQFLESSVAPALRRKGEIYDLGKEHSLGPHSGVYHYDADQSIDLGTRSVPVPLKMAHYSYREHIIEVAPATYFKSGGVHLVNCHFQGGMDLSIPSKGYLKINNEYHEAMLYPKNLNSIYVELTEGLNFTFGETLTCYKKKGKNSKVYFSGQVKRLGKFNFIEKTDDIENDNLAEPNAHHEKSF